MSAAENMFAPLSEEELSVSPSAGSSPRDPSDDWQPAVIVPANAPRPSFQHKDLGEPVAIWEYRNAAGELEGYQCRFDVLDANGQPVIDPDTGKQKKEFRPRRWGTAIYDDGQPRTGWHWKSWGEGRPLYRLPKMLAKPDAWVIITEGEKKADAVPVVFPDMVGVSPMNGAKSPGKTDWSHVAGRMVAISTDNDEAGLKFGDEVCALVRAAEAKAVYWLRPDRLGAWEIRDGRESPREGGCPEKYDLADALRDGWTAEMVTARRTDPSFFTPYRDAAEREEDRRQWEGLGVNFGDESAGPDEDGNEEMKAEIASSINDVVNRFNAKYAVINEAGKAVVYYPKWDVLLERNVIERIAFEDLRRMYMNEHIPVSISQNGNVKYESAAEVWLKHSRRLQFLGGVVMDPTDKAPADCWNLWSGYAIQPKQGDWSKMRAHIRDIVCSGDDALFAYVLGWLARMIQHPEKPGEVALVLRGEKGAGKGTLGKWLLKIFGQHGIQVAHAHHLIGNFNAHLRDAVFVFADEAFFAGDKQNEGALKALITESFLTIEAKHQNAVTVRNMTHIMMASNSDWVVPASGQERRFCVMDVSNDRLQDHAYFAELDRQAENGGLAAMLYDLQRHDISGFNFRSVPTTEALAEQKRLSLESLDRWWLTVLHRGFVYRSKYGARIFTDWSEFVATDLLYRSYLQWCNETKVRHPESYVTLGKMMTKMYKSSRPRSGSHPVGENKSLDYNKILFAQTGNAADPDALVASFKERPTGYKIGLLDAAREAFARKVGVSFDWGVDTEASEDDREQFEV